MGNKIASIAIAFILTLTVVGCAGSAQSPMMESYDAPAPMEDMASGEQNVASEPGSGGANYSSVERLIIRNGSFSIVAPDTETALDEIAEMADELEGYVVESNKYQYQEGWRASVTLRVPAKSFDAALDRIRNLATEVRHENISGQDVTEEYIDLHSRLRYLEATESRLLEFLQEAEDTESALDVYEQLQRIQADIEHVKGRMQYLEQSAAMATITLDITPDELAQPIQVGGWNPKGTARDAIQSLVRMLQFLADALIVIVILVIPILLVIAIPLIGLFLLARGIVRWRRARKVSKAAK